MRRNVAHWNHQAMTGISGYTNKSIALLIMGSPHWLWLIDILENAAGAAAPLGAQELLQFEHYVRWFGHIAGGY